MILKIFLLLMFDLFCRALNREISYYLSNIRSCYYVIPKNPVFTIVKVPILGVASQSECVMRMVQFDWSIGLFCPSSMFCGFGLELDRAEVKNGDVLEAERAKAADELCFVMIRSDKTECESFMATLYKIGILQRKFWNTVLVAEFISCTTL